MSTPHTLRKLQEFGFKTFDGFIDESYDKELDDLKRTQMIFDELDKFRNKSDKELKDWWKEILPVLEHNQKTFINMGNKKTKKIKLLEKLND
jgi:recombination DNA repair RAD52 pathway protein